MTRRPTDWNTARYFLGRSASLLGDQIYFVVISWAAVRLDGPIGAGVVLACASAPRAVLMIAGGAIVDRVGIRRLMLGSELARGSLMSAVAAALVFTHLNFSLLIAISLVFGIFDAAFYPAEAAMAPFLTDNDHLIQVNGFREVSRQLALLLGPPAGGVLVAVFGIGTALGVDAVSFIASVTTLYFTTTTEPETANRGRPVPTQRFTGQIREGLSCVWRQPVLRALLPVTATVDLVFSAPGNVGVAVLSNTRHWGSAGLGLLIGSLGVGALIGAGVVTRRWLIGTPGATAMAAVAILGAGLIGAGLIHNEWAACGALAVGGIGMSIAGALFFTIAQTATPRAFMGRVMSLVMFSSLGLMPVAYLLTGILSRVIGAPALFAGAGAIEILAASIGMAIPAVRTPDSPEQRPRMAAGDSFVTSTPSSPVPLRNVAPTDK